MSCPAWVKTPWRRPGKAIELDESLRAEMNLADRWHIPLGELRARMPAAEMVLWMVYFAKQDQDREVSGSAT